MQLVCGAFSVVAFFSFAHLDALSLVGLSSSTQFGSPNVQVCEQIFATFAATVG